MRLNNPGLVGSDDLRDLWNQQTPFADRPKRLQPLFLQRLKDSLDGLGPCVTAEADWAPDALAASANVFLDDFLLFDVAKPITDDKPPRRSRRARSTADLYQTGGGRTVDANVDRHPADLARSTTIGEFLQGGADRGQRSRARGVPVPRDAEHRAADRCQSRRRCAAPDEVWSLIGPFAPTWHPRSRRVRSTGRGVGQLRTIETVDGREIVERLEAIDDAKRSYRYTRRRRVPASHYTGAARRLRRRASGSVARMARRSSSPSGATRHRRERPWCRLWSETGLEA